MYRTVATTADLDSDDKIVLEKGEGEVNAVQIGDPRPLEINKPVTITLTLPANFATSNETLYIQHIKDGGRTYYYTGTVDSKNLTFTNPNGFSTFTVSTTNGAVAEIRGRERRLTPTPDGGRWITLSCAPVKTGVRG